MDNVILKGTVRYDGTNFAGWQTQAGRRTVQESLEGALSQIAQRPIAVQGAGRTDAGVHALGQVFSCAWPGAMPPRLRASLCKMLRPDIAVTELAEAAPDFSARFSATSKRYVYALDLRKELDPFTARYAWHVPHAVDLNCIRESVLPLLGKHDFAGFQSAGSQIKTTVRTILDIQLEPGGIVTPTDAHGLWRIVYHGDAFLYKMVRNLSGVLVEIARGRFPREFLFECLHAKGPFMGHCAPAHGLALLEVRYDGRRRKCVTDDMEA